MDDQATKKQTKTERGVYLGVAGLGVAVIWILGTRLVADMQLLAANIKSARNAPVAYVGLSGDNPDWRPRECVREVDGKRQLWAGIGLPGQSRWFDVTGTELPVEQFRQAVGRDNTFKTIDFPIFEKPDGLIATQIYPEEEVFGIVFNGQATAYPITVMRKVFMVHQTFRDHHVVVTYNSLKDAEAIFAVEMKEGEPLSFGHSGYFFQEIPIVYDRETDSLWNMKASALESFAGPLAGKSLKPLQGKKLERTTLAEWTKRHPDTDVLVGADRAKPVPLARKQ